MAGFVALHRKVRRNWVYEPGRPRTLFEAWLDILMEVQHSPEARTVELRGVVLKCHRGQSLNSLATWAERWHWSKSRVDRFLRRLEREGMIELTNEGATKRLSVCQYAVYNPPRDDRETVTETVSETQTGRKAKRLSGEVSETCDSPRDGKRNGNRNGKRNANRNQTTMVTNKGTEQGTSSGDDDPILRIFTHWNSYAGRSVEKSGDDGSPKTIARHAHELRPDGFISPHIVQAIQLRLEDYSAEDICTAIDNYAMALLRSESRWTRRWSLAKFLTRTQSGGLLQLCRFLPDDFDSEEYSNGNSHHERHTNTSRRGFADQESQFGITVET